MTLKSPARWAAVAWCTVPVVYAVLLVAPSVTLPGDDLGFRRFQTPQLAPHVMLGQTFDMTGDGLFAIEVFPTTVGPRVSGSVLFDLHDVTEDGKVRLPKRRIVSVADLVKAPSYRFEFLPILDSMDRSYRLDLVSSLAEGVAFLATKGERYAGGSLRINNQERWADMAFRVHAPAPSRWRLFMTLRETNPVRAYTVIAVCLAAWLLLGFMLGGIAEMSDASRLTDSSRSAPQEQPSDRLHGVRSRSSN